MNIILYAVPFFFALIALELVMERVRGTDYYRVNDSLTSLATGVINQVVNVAQRLIPFTLYVWVEQEFALFSLPDNAWWMWVIAFIAYDFFYYWNHRFGHEINILWASHVVHHSSEDYNLTTALRQTGTGFLSVIFYLPMALIGFDPLMVISVGALNLVYQFWVHTRHVGKLGWFEWFFVSPSNHRAHHAQNAVYIDKNYGGVFILWDRLFGTYQEELDSDPVIFGITGAVKSWNPLWVNAQVYAHLVHDAWHTTKWRDKLRIWFMRTGWRPQDVAERFPLDKVDLSRFQKFDVPLPSKLKIYGVLQYVQVATVALFFSISASALSLEQQCYVVLYVLAGLFGIGAVMEGKHYAGVFEWLRNAMLMILLLNLSALLSSWIIIWLLIVTLLSMPLLVFGRVNQAQATVSSS